MSRVWKAAWLALPVIALGGGLAAAASAGAETAGTPPSGAGSSSPAAVAPSRAKLERFVCRRAVDPEARKIAVTAVMRPIPGTLRMAMRFELLQRTRGHSGATPVAGPKLGEWITPSHDPTLGQQPDDRWMVRHPVRGLDAPARYRLLVQFRWTGAGGRVLATVSRLSRSCSQPVLAPDLAVLGFDRRGAVVANLGRTNAGAFDVAMSVGAGGGSGAGAQQSATATVLGLAPGARQRVRFRGIACPAGSPVTIVADPDGRIPDPDRSNNTLSSTCPAP